MFRLVHADVKVLRKMEKEGIAIDVDGLGVFSKQLELESIEKEKEIKTLAGIDFNLDSPKQLGEVLFDHMKISAKAKKTKTGQYQTSEDAL